MARIQPPQPDGDFGGYAGFEGDGDGFGRRRKLVRYGVPVAIAGVAATTIGLGTALANTSSSPSLPGITAEQLINKIANSKVQTVSGSVRITTDLGLPNGVLDGGLAGAAGAGGSPFGGHGGGGRSGPSGSAADPQAKLTELLSGTHTLQVAADGPDRQKLSIVDNTSEYSVIHDGDQTWAYDSGSNAVYHATRPAGAAKDNTAMPATPKDAVSKALKAVDPTTSVTVDGTAEVAGRTAYQLLITPKQADTTVGAIRIAVDAKNFTPLKFTLTPKGSDKAVVDIGYTKVDFGRPAARTFNFTVPKGAKVTEQPSGADQRKADNGARPGSTVFGKDWDSVIELKGGPNGQAPNGTSRNGNGQGDKGMTGSGMSGLLGSFGHKVSGGFGSGTVINTRLVNVLITDKGTVFAGAVTQDGLIKAADSAK